MFLLCILSFIAGVIFCTKICLVASYALAVNEGRTQLSYEVWLKYYKMKFKNVDMTALQEKVKMLNK